MQSLGQAKGVYIRAGRGEIANLARIKSLNPNRTFRNPLMAGVAFLSPTLVIMESKNENVKNCLIV